MKRYILVGATPLRAYTGTTTYTSLRVVASADTHAEVKALTEEHFEACGGLLRWIDRETGLPGEPKAVRRRRS